jgi:hypothetical protein
MIHNSISLLDLTGLLPFSVYFDLAHPSYSICFRQCPHINNYILCSPPDRTGAGENAWYTLLAFISIQMEMYWWSNPVGKVHCDLPSLRNLIEGNFTQSA